MTPCLDLVTFPRRLHIAFGLPLRVLICAVKIGGHLRGMSFRLGWALREELAVEMGKGYKGGSRWCNCGEDVEGP